MDIKEIEIGIARGSGVRHPWEQARLQSVQSFLEGYKPARQSPVFLDIGSGDCYVIEQLHRRFPSARFIGIDIHYSAEFLEAQQKKFSGRGIYLFRTLEEGFAKAQEYETVDYVFLLDVLEHIQDDGQFLSDLTTHIPINKQSRFIAYAPAYQALFSHHDVFFRHHRRYTSESLANVFARARCKTQEQGYFFTFLLPFRIIDLLFQKMGVVRQIPECASTWRAPAFVTKALAALLFFDFRINRFLSARGISLPGLSCYVVASL